MPLKTVIHANTDLITTIQVARVKGRGMKPGDVNIYAVAETDDPTWLIDWDNLPVRFEHEYGQGAALLIAKAIIALETYKNQR